MIGRQRPATNRAVHLSSVSSELVGHSTPFEAGALPCATRRCQFVRLSVKSATMGTEVYYNTTWCVMKQTTLDYSYN